MTGFDPDPPLPGAARADGAQTAVSFGEAFRFWLTLGFISFGGPAGQIAIMHRELVERRRWISETRFLHALNYCMLLPGPEAQQLATYIGWLMHRTWGGMVALALFVLPSVFILLALSSLYAAHGDVAAVAGVLDGFKPVVVAIVVEAVLKIGGRALRRRAPYLSAVLSGVTAAVVGVVLNLALVFGAAVIWPEGVAGGTRWFTLAISAAAFALLYRYQIDVLWVVLGGGAVGLAARLWSGG